MPGFLYLADTLNGRDFARHGCASAGPRVVAA